MDDFKRQEEWQRQARETIKNPRTSQRRGPKRLRERLVQSQTIRVHNADNPLGLPETMGNLESWKQEFGQEIRFVSITVLVKWHNAKNRYKWKRAVKMADVEAIHFPSGDIGHNDKGQPSLMAFTVRASEGQIAELLQCQSIYRTDEKDTAPQKRRIGKRKGAAKLALHDGIVYLDASIPYRASGDGTPKVKASSKPGKGKWYGVEEQERESANLANQESENTISLDGKTIRLSNNISIRNVLGCSVLSWYNDDGYWQAVVKGNVSTTGELFLYVKSHKPCRIKMIPPTRFLRSHPHKPIRIETVR